MMPWPRLFKLRSRDGRLPGPKGLAMRRHCIACLHFRNDPAEIEAAVPGLMSLSSAQASVRADDGLCLNHDRLVTARSSCAAFRPAQPGHATGLD